jgi:hypothetical protein
MANLSVEDVNSTDSPLEGRPGLGGAVETHYLFTDSPYLRPARNSTSGTDYMHSSTSSFTQLAQHLPSALPSSISPKRAVGPATAFVMRCEEKGSSSGHVLTTKVFDARDHMGASRTSTPGLPGGNGSAISYPGGSGAGVGGRSKPARYSFYQNLLMVANRWFGLGLDRDSVGAGLDNRSLSMPEPSGGSYPAQSLLTSVGAQRAGLEPANRSLPLLAAAVATPRRNTTGASFLPDGSLVTWKHRPKEGSSSSGEPKQPTRSTKLTAASPGSAISSAMSLPPVQPQSDFVFMDHPPTPLHAPTHPPGVPFLLATPKIHCDLPSQLRGWLFPEELFKLPTLCQPNAEEGLGHTKEALTRSQRRIYEKEVTEKSRKEPTGSAAELLSTLGTVIQVFSQMEQLYHTFQKMSKSPKRMTFFRTVVKRQLLSQLEYLLAVRCPVWAGLLYCHCSAPMALPSESTGGQCASNAPPSLAVSSAALIGLTALYETLAAAGEIQLAAEARQVLSWALATSQQSRSVPHTPNKPNSGGIGSGSETGTPPERSHFPRLHGGTTEFGSFVSNQPEQELFSCSLCCQVIVPKDHLLVVKCSQCGHGGHVHHMEQWFAVESVCPAGCYCHCTFTQAAADES